MEYLDELAKAAGIRLIVGNLYIGGCSLERHWENVSKGLPAYDYRKNCEGVQSNTPKTSLLSALQDEPWDYITVQQVSQNSGLYDTYYPFMPSLLQYLRTHATNPGVRFAIHQVWAYACDSNHSGFANYDNDQSRMYREIVKTVNRVSRKEHIPIVIPSGTAIQTGRNLMGDRMTPGTDSTSITDWAATSQPAPGMKLFSGRSKAIRSTPKAYRPGKPHWANVSHTRPCNIPTSRVS